MSDMNDMEDALYGALSLDPIKRPVTPETTKRRAGSKNKVSASRTKPVSVPDVPSSLPAESSSSTAAAPSSSAKDKNKRRAFHVSDLAALETSLAASGIKDTPPSSGTTSGSKSGSKRNSVTKKRASISASSTKSSKSNRSTRSNKSNNSTKQGPLVPLPIKLAKDGSLISPSPSKPGPAVSPFQRAVAGTSDFDMFVAMNPEVGDEETAPSSSMPDPAGIASNAVASGSKLDSDSDSSPLPAPTEEAPQEEPELDPYIASKLASFIPDPVPAPEKPIDPDPNFQSKSEGISPAITHLIAAIMPWLDEEGIFRISGSQPRVREILDHIYKSDFDFIKSVKDPHNLAGALKLYYRESPQPLIPEHTLAIFLKYFESTKDGSPERIKGYQEALDSLDFNRRRTFAFMIHFFIHMLQYTASNKMNEANIAMVFAPAFVSSNGSFNTFTGALGNVHRLIFQVIMFSRRLNLWGPEKSSSATPVAPPPPTSS